MNEGFSAKIQVVKKGAAIRLDKPIRLGPCIVPGNRGEHANEMTQIVEMVGVQTMNKIVFIRLPRNEKLTEVKKVLGTAKHSP